MIRRSLCSFVPVLACIVVLPAIASQATTHPSKPLKPPFKVLYTNDVTNIVGCVSPYHRKTQSFEPDMLRASIDEAKDADVQLLQPGLGWVPWWKSELYPPKEHYQRFMDRTGLQPDSFGTYMLAGGDLVQLFVETCRRQGIVPFISFRLNDVHHLEHAGRDTKQSQRVSLFYEQHPEYRLDPKGQSPNDRLQNWALPEVREHKFAFIRELCKNYDIDGLELDFMRHRRLFQLDETTSSQRRQIITDFVRRVRDLLDRTAKPGRHRWLCARVPCFLSDHDPLGIDLPSLAEAGLEMANLSAFYFTLQQSDLARIRRMVPDIAIYLEMTHCTMVGPSGGGYDSFTFRRTTDPQFYTTAHLAYERGADGVSLFNFAYFREHGKPGRGPFNEPPFHILQHLGDPAWLAQQPQWYVMAQTSARVKGAPQMPTTLKPGQSRLFSLDMSPIMTGRNGLLRFMTANPSTDGCWTVTVNNRTLTPADCVANPIDHPYEAEWNNTDRYQCFTCPPDLLEDGQNEITIRLNSGPSATINYLDVILP